MFQSSLFSPHKNLAWGMSEAKDGPMERSVDISAGRVSPKNRTTYFTKQQIPFAKVIGLASSHGGRAQYVRKKDTGKILPDTDGLVTDAKNVFLSVTIADCFPIYLYEPKAGIVGLAHAGWRGIVSNVVSNTVDEIKALGGDKNEILAFIGPGIRECHFEVQSDVKTQFARYSESISTHAEKTFIHLPEIIARELDSSGISPDRVEEAGVCTFCEKNTYFSYRRDKPQKPELMIAYIGMK